MYSCPLACAEGPPPFHARSSTRTDAPAARASRAAHTPAPPAPTITTSASACQRATSLASRGWDGLAVGVGSGTSALLGSQFAASTLAQPAHTCPLRHRALTIRLTRRSAPANSERTGEHHARPFRQALLPRGIHSDERRDAPRSEAETRARLHDRVARGDVGGEGLPACVAPVSARRGTGRD